MLTKLGLYNKKGTILLLGLDNAGKTTLLHTLKNECVTQLAPTMHMTCEEFMVGDIQFTAYDVGGHGPARRIWSTYFAICDAVVFIVDMADMDRIAEARAELANLLDTESLSHTPFLILGNKIDIAACSEGDLLQYLGIRGTGKNGKNERIKKDENDKKDDLSKRPLELFLCSLKANIGVYEGFQWLGTYM